MELKLHICYYGRGRGFGSAKSQRNSALWGNLPHLQLPLRNSRRLSFFIERFERHILSQRLEVLELLNRLYYTKWGRDCDVVECLATVVNRHLASFASVSWVSHALIDNLLDSISSPNMCTLLSILRVYEVLRHKSGCWAHDASMFSIRGHIKWYLICIEWWILCPLTLTSIESISSTKIIVLRILVR